MVLLGVRSHGATSGGGRRHPGPLVPPPEALLWVSERTSQLPLRLQRPWGCRPGSPQRGLSDSQRRPPYPRNQGEGETQGQRGAASRGQRQNQSETKDSGSSSCYNLWLREDCALLAHNALE